MSTYCKLVFAYSVFNAGAAFHLEVSMGVRVRGVQARQDKGSWGEEVQGFGIRQASNLREAGRLGPRCMQICT